MKEDAQYNIISGIISRQRINSLKKEIFRKSIHICSAFVPLALKYFYRPVIFLLLFVVLLAFVQLETQEDSLNSEEVEELQQELADYQETDYNYDTLEESYQNSIAQYSELDQLVGKVSIFCNYNPNDKTTRTIKVLIPGREAETIILSPGHTDSRYAQLETLLEDFIKSNQEQSDRSKDATAGTSFTIICLSLDKIQRGDRERIDKIAADLMERYENVYYRKFRAD